MNEICKIYYNKEYIKTYLLFKTLNTHMGTSIPLIWIDFYY